MLTLPITPDKQYRTHAGHEVRIYAIDGEPPFRIHGARSALHGWRALSWDEEGKFGLLRTDNTLDLMDAVEHSAKQPATA